MEMCLFILFCHWPFINSEDNGPCGLSDSIDLRPKYPTMLKTFYWMVLMTSCRVFLLLLISIWTLEIVFPSDIQKIWERRVCVFLLRFLFGIKIPDSQYSTNGPQKHWLTRVRHFSCCSKFSHEMLMYKLKNICFKTGLKRNLGTAGKCFSFPSKMFPHQCNANDLLCVEPEVEYLMR